MPENQYRVLNLFRHNYPVNRGEFLRNPETVSEEKLTKLVADGFLEKVTIVTTTENPKTAKTAKVGEEVATKSTAEVKPNDKAR